jgi:hypothetical protein
MIKLPTLFAEKLALNPSLLADVQSSFAAFSPWLANSGMPFFPGFTDHSPTHINDVLSSAASLISDSSHDLITPEDVTVLCMAILLHDAGMHLTADSFRSLVNDSSPPLVNGFGDIPWSQLWREFLAEAHRFGQEKLLAIFGDTAPLRVDALDLQNLTEKDHLLIGEFVRRHHTRLAHEIALIGVGRHGAQPIKLNGLSEAICDISGLVARSHGMPIRKTFDYLRAKYGNIAVCRKIKVPYLMAVLRIADYIQVKSERAIAQLLSVKELKSPISRQEWKNHFAISDVHTYHADPEAIFVEAAPVDVKTFAKLASLFKDIQRELDESWATIGEVYGRMGELEKLGLNSRRVRSNLDSLDEFSKTVPYIPVNARFDSSGPDLLKLLVGPLYDYEISVGIRELMQNAIDACREAHDLYSQRGVEAVEPDKPDVTVEIVEEEDGSGYVLISDNGVGMTVETITRYFLIAGASFRNSDIWKRQHIDKRGRPKISRGGRFGIGALAAFLLGEEINVTTRHIDKASHEGITFNAKIDESHVQLTKSTAPQGTSFKVVVKDPATFDELRPNFPLKEEYSKNFRLEDWPVVDWFVQARPRVIVKWSGFNISRKTAAQTGWSRIRLNAEFDPPVDDLVPVTGGDVTYGEWKALEITSQYDAILWRYQKPRSKKRGNETFTVIPPDELIVNGLRVQSFPGGRPKLQLPEHELASGPIYSIDRPSIAIYDPSGIAPINLQRSKIAFDRMAIDFELALDVMQTQMQRFSTSILNPLNLGDLVSLLENFVGLRGINFEGQVAPLGYARNGLILLEPAMLHSLKLKRLIILDLCGDDFQTPLEGLVPDDSVIIIRTPDNGDGAQSSLAWFRGIFCPQFSVYHARNIGLPFVQPICQVSLMPTSRWKSANVRGRVARYILDPIHFEEKSSEQILAYSGTIDSVDATKDLINAISLKLSEKSEISIWELSDEEFESESSLLAKSWKKFANDLVWTPASESGHSTLP